jgi:hypothetical protein
VQNTVLKELAEGRTTELLRSSRDGSREQRGFRVQG